MLQTSQGIIRIGSSVFADYEWRHAMQVFLRETSPIPLNHRNRYRRSEINLGKFVLAFHWRTNTCFAYMNEAMSDRLPLFVSASGIIELHRCDYVRDALVKFLVKDEVDQIGLMLPCRGWVWINKKDNREPLDLFWSHLPTSSQLKKAFPAF